MVEMFKRSKSNVLAVGAVLFISLIFSSGCGTPIRDGLPIAFIPNVIRVKVNDITSFQVSLSKPREKEGVMLFKIDDETIIKPAEQKAEVPVKPGDTYVTFTIQGLKSGITTIYARMKGEGETIATKVVVAPK